jgi:nucleotide-binding universal stress UspA family protein
MFHTILAPLDGSRAAEYALPLARTLARHTGATLRLVQVLPDLADRFFWAPLPGTSTDFDLRQHHIERARDYLQTWARRIEGDGISVQCDIVAEEESIAESIRGDALRTGADLIVMINQGRGVLGRFWYGSIADELVRSVQVPVLLVPCKTAPEHPDQEANLRHILVALDGKPEAERILPPALEIARAMGADLTLVRVVPSAPRSASLPASGGPEALRYLEAAAEQLRGTGTTIHTRLLVASQTAKALLHDADSEDDLLALETPGRHGLDRLLHPGVVDAVLHDSKHPVLVLRPAVPKPMAV